MIESKMNKEEIKSRIMAIFEQQGHQADCLIEIYKLFVPDWDSIEVINGWPACGEAMWKFIAGQFQAFDEKHHPKCLPGGMWMNTGFSCESKLPPWSVDLSTCTIKRY